MTPIEFIEKEYGHAWLKFDWNVGDVQDALAEYGKHCAEQAWREAERNMLRSVRVITFESWWSEFQRKEATE